MKIEQLIVQHLYNNKRVTLQDIGSFVLSSHVAMPSESEKDGVMPDNAISFEYNTKATEDESLVDFIVQQTRKIKPLAKSDLESYTILGREYLNIGKPFPIEGLGTLQKSQSGQYEFIQGHIVNPKLQAAPALLKEKHDEEIIFATPIRKPSNNKAGAILIALLTLVVIAAALIYFLNKKEEKLAAAESFVADTTVNQIDTIVSTPVPIADTNRSINPIIPGDTSAFKIVIKQYPTSDAANKALTKLSSYGHKLVMYQVDSLTYRLAMPFNSPLSDTLHVKDSLKRFFGGNPFVELR